MCEFVAEKATSDICEGLTRDSWKECGNINVDYSNLYNMFDDDGGPEAFLERYMQLAWNGDSALIDAANSKVGTILENCRWIYGLKN